MIRNELYYGMMDLEDNRYDLPAWMQDEQYENCDGFMKDYCRAISDRIFGIFGKKN